MRPRRHAIRRSRRRARGMLLLGVLVLLGVMAALGAEIGMRWADDRQRADEEELLFVGEQYRQAIESYWRSTPGGVRQWPTRLDDLIADNRYPQPRRHLRKLYPDPVAPDQPWGLVQVGAGIVGVHSQSEAEPFRRSGFTMRQAGFTGAARYADWKFSVVVPAGPLPTNPAAKPPAPPVPGPTIPPLSPRPSRRPLP